MSGQMKTVRERYAGAVRKLPKFKGYPGKYHKVFNARCGVAGPVDVDVRWGGRSLGLILLNGKRRELYSP